MAEVASDGTICVYSASGLDVYVTLACDPPQESCVARGHRGLRAVHVEVFVILMELHDIDGLVQSCGNSNALALELLQFCIKP